MPFEDVMTGRLLYSSDIRRFKQHYIRPTLNEKTQVYNYRLAGEYGYENLYAHCVNHIKNKLSDNVVSVEGEGVNTTAFSQAISQAITKIITELLCFGKCLVKWERDDEGACVDVIPLENIISVKHDDGAVYEALYRKTCSTRSSVLEALSMQKDVITYYCALVDEDDASGYGKYVYESVQYPVSDLAYSADFEDAVQFIATGGAKSRSLKENRAPDNSIAELVESEVVDGINVPMFFFELDPASVIGAQIQSSCLQYFSDATLISCFDQRYVNPLLVLSSDGENSGMQRAMGKHIEARESDSQKSSYYIIGKDAKMEYVQPDNQFMVDLNARHKELKQAILQSGRVISAGRTGRQTLGDGGTGSFDADEQSSRIFVSEISKCLKVQLHQMAMLAFPEATSLDIKGLDKTSYEVNRADLVVELSGVRIPSPTYTKMKLSKLALQDLNEMVNPETARQIISEISQAVDDETDKAEQADQAEGDDK
jgi:hypothetical protein